MKKTLLALNLAYYLFGTTIYVGVMWALKFFWYPSWEVMTVDTVQNHFIIPTSAATRFFLVVVPIMFVSGLIMLISEWRKKYFWAVVVAYLGIIGATYVGWIHIIPINRTIAKGITDPAQLNVLLRQWMFLNDIRWVIVTIMWAALVYYIFAKGQLFDALVQRREQPRTQHA